MSTESTLCVNCNQPFSSQNVYSEAGWKETQISGLCELCFDDITLTAEEYTMSDMMWIGSEQQKGGDPGPN